MEWLNTGRRFIEPERVYSDVDDSEVHWVFRRKSIVTRLAEGEKLRVYDATATARASFVVLSGSVRVTFLDADGSRLGERILERGDRSLASQPQEVLALEPGTELVRL